MMFRDDALNTLRDCNSKTLKERGIERTGRLTPSSRHESGSCYGPAGREPHSKMLFVWSGDYVETQSTPDIT